MTPPSDSTTTEPREVTVSSTPHDRLNADAAVDPDAHHGADADEATDPSSAPDPDPDPDSVLSTLDLEDGRIPPRSAVIVAGIAGLTMLVLGVAAGHLLATGGGLVLGAALASAITLVDSDLPLPSLIGGLGLLGSVGGAVGLPAYLIAMGSPAAGGLVAAAIAVGMGSVTCRLPAMGGGAVSRAIAWILRVLFVTAIGGLVVAVVSLDVGQLAAALGTVGPLATLVAPPEATTAAVGFILLSWLALAAIWLFVAVLPPATVVPMSKRTTYRQVRSRVWRVAGVLLGGGGLVVGMAYLLGAEAGIAATVAAGTVVPIVESTMVRTAFIQAFLIGALLSGLVLFGVSVGARLAYRRPSWIVSGVAVAGGVFFGAFVSADAVIERLGASGVVSPVILDPATAIVGPTALGMGGAVFGLGAIAAVLVVLPVLSGLGLVPTATAGPRLAVLGLIVAVISVVAGDAGGSAVLVGAVGAVVVWDVGEYGVGQTADIGPMPAQRDGEFIHAGASLLVGAVGLLVTVGLYQLVIRIGAGGNGAVAVVLIGAFVTVVLAGLLRG